jgi:hypothetical protein
MRERLAIVGRGRIGREPAELPPTHRLDHI